MTGEPRGLQPDDLEAAKHEPDSATSTTTPERFSAQLQWLRERLGEPRGSARPPLRTGRWLRIIGPGLITGAADDDPSGIGTYSQAGAAYGSGLLWLALYCCH